MAIDGFATIGDKLICPLHDDNFDMAKMRERVAHWILMREHPFSILEKVSCNLMMKEARPEWKKISCQNEKMDSMQVYDIEKKNLKAALRNVESISITINLWRSKTQKIKYMVVTAHWVNTN